MKKIMFNNTYGLTQAVKQGYKTMTRRVLYLTEEDAAWLDHTFDWDLCESDILERYAQYQVGEIVAVAEPYKDIIGDRVFFVSYETGVSVHRSIMEREKGWSSMFLRCSRMSLLWACFWDREAFALCLQRIFP